jgi:hypothetical protein
MEAARTSETSVDVYLTTRQYNPEDSELQNHYMFVLLGPLLEPKAQQFWSLTTASFISCNSRFTLIIQATTIIAVAKSTILPSHMDDK